MTRAGRMVLALADLRAEDVASAGGKAANLGELVRLGMPVPPGFAVTTAAFDAFMSGCPDLDGVYALLDGVAAHDVAAARDAGHRVRRALLDVPIPTDVAQAVLQAWRAAGAEKAYAVRSSATAEDLPGASFAGQQESYPNVRGEQPLLDAVRRCWVSLFTDRAILYRVENRFGHRQVQLAVIVQEMVAAEVSGVLFTADPVTGHRPTSTVEAGFGLGESLVGGLVSPDLYYVDKRSRRIIERHIGSKRTAALPLEGGGTQQVGLQPGQSVGAALTDEQVLTLADLGARVEAHYGVPQDIEWAAVGGVFHVLQTRPITSLFPLDGVRSPDGTLHVFFNMGYQQNMTRAMTPLGMSCVRALVPHAHAERRIESDHVRPNGGRLFADLTLPLRHPVLRKVVLDVLSQFDALAPDALLLAMERPEFQHATPVGLSPGAVRRTARLLLRVQKALWWDDPDGGPAAVDDLVERHVREVRRRLAGTTSEAARIRAVIDVLQHLYLVVLLWVPRFVAGAVAHRLLLMLAEDWADPADLASYNLGAPGNVVTEMTLALGEVAEAARRSPGLLAWFDHVGDDSRAWLTAAANFGGSRPFVERWQTFLQRYGCRGSAEVDVGTARWYEEPLPLIRTLSGYVKQDAGSHRRRQAELEREARAASERLEVAAGFGPLGGLRSQLVRRLVHVSRAGAALREHHKFLAVRILREIKEVLKETAVELTESGRLTRPDDIWFLTLPEVLALADGADAEAVGRIPSRRADLARFDVMRAPMVLTSDGERPVVAHHVDGAPPGALLGQPVSSGVVEATVRVIHDPRAETLAPGEVLVAAFTDPGWTPLFGNASALITEVGGLLTHGSVVAREYGIPAIVGVREATTRLATGQRVRIDGGRGVIEVLDPVQP